MFIAQVFNGFTTTAIPSRAIRNSVYSIPFVAQSAASEDFIGREASLMSVSPTLKRLKPHFRLPSQY